MGRKACVEHGCFSSSFTSKGSVFFVDRKTAMLPRAPGRDDVIGAQKSKRTAVPWLADRPARSPAETTDPKGAKASTVRGTATISRVFMARSESIHPDTGSQQSQWIDPARAS
jgi:hypothetical protein